MSEIPTKPPPELVRAQEIYRRAFSKVLVSEGLNSKTIAQLARSGRVPIIQAECNETDGELTLPAAIEHAVIDPFITIPSPPKDDEPVLVRSISLGRDYGTIEIEPKLIGYSSIIDGFLTTGPNIAVSSSIFFDFVGGKYYTSIIKLDEKGNIRFDENPEDPVISEEHDLTPEMIHGFKELLPHLVKREESVIVAMKYNP